MDVLVGVLLGETTPERASRLAEIFHPCPYCASFAIAGGTVVGLYAMPADHGWWLEWVEEQPQETLGLERAEVLFAQHVTAASPWSRGEVQPTQEHSPCGAACPECPNYRQECPGCPATQYYLGAGDGR
jgi:hypothetical protein